MTPSHDRTEASLILRILALAVILLSTADHWTTYQCLIQPAPGFTVAEGNPLAAWLFERIGLVPGLLLDSAITLCAMWVIIRTELIPRGARIVFLSATCAWTGLAVWNNLTILHTLTSAAALGVAAS